MNEQNRIWSLLSKKLAGEATEKERIELDQLLQKNPNIQYFANIIGDLWKPGLKHHKDEIENAFVSHVKRMEQHVRMKQLSQKMQNRTSFKSFVGTGILNNYIKVIFRNLTRYKGFSLINISGLAIGMASAILILLWIQNELSTDQFHEKKDRIYLMYNRGMFDGKLETWAGTSMALAPILKNDYPQVEKVARMNGIGPFVLTVGDKHFADPGNIVDPDFLKIFSYPLVRGNVETALSSPRSIVITEKFARKLFNETDVMGKVIKLDSSAYFTVSGVMKDLPNNTTFRFEYLLPFSYMKEVKWENLNWEYTGVLTFVLLRPGVTEQTADSRFRDIVKSHSNLKTELFVHPLTKWQLYSRFENGKIVGGNIENVRLFGMLAAFILLIACINYMNLSTARSVKRAREVGIRKVVGAGKYSIVLRFLGESIMISALSCILGLIIAQLSIGGFNWLTWKELYIPYENFYFWIAIIGFILITGLIAGSYPAFYLATYKPISILKGTFKKTYNLVNIRKILVVLQFSFAITFIICTIIIYRQIDFGMKRDPGYNRDRLAFVYVKGEMMQKYPLIKSELLGSGLVSSVTRSNSPITYTWSADDSYTWTGSNPNVKTSFSQFFIDNDFLQTVGLKLVSGRDINTNIYSNDSTAMLLTESAAKTMGLTNPVGQIVKNKMGNWTIVGIVKDFIPGSPFYSIQPTVLLGPKSWFGAVTFRLSGRNNAVASMKKIEAIFDKHNPGYLFEYRFVDQADAEKFEDERRQGIQSAIFGGMAIFISCLGLFALAAYTTENRIKEIGVRKILGASVTGIATLLSKDFLKLVLISYVIASPIAWWTMNSWLQNFPYRINIGWWIFLLAGFLSILIAIATVSYQAIRAALANPVVNLRSE